MKFGKYIVPVLEAVCVMVILCTGCAQRTVDDGWWGSAEAWYDNGREVNPEYADVFYLYSTEVASSVDQNGNKSYKAALTDAEKELLDYELHSSNTKIFPDSLNFIAPYYHQYTLESLDLPEDDRNALIDEVASEVLDAFDYYMENINDGRRFILAGFSQGGKMALEILKHLSNDQYGRMIAAYLIGFRVSAEDMECGHISPAVDRLSNGVTVSFNSVASPDAFWDFVNKDAAFCTNPINWSADGTPAEFEYEGQTLTVKVDRNINSLIVKGVDIEDYKYELLEKYCKPGNLHHWDIKFYRPYLRRNALDRAYRK